MDYNNSEFWKKNENAVPFQNGGQITDFISILAKIWRKKKIFLKEFFNEIWLKLGEHEYIYITEITLKKMNPF